MIRSNLPTPMHSTCGYLSAIEIHHVAVVPLPRSSKRVSLTSRSPQPSSSKLTEIKQPRCPVNRGPPLFQLEHLVHRSLRRLPMDTILERLPEHISRDELDRSSCFVAWPDYREQNQRNKVGGELRLSSSADGAGQTDCSPRSRPGTSGPLGIDRVVV